MFFFSLSGAEMTNESIKALLMITLYGGVRTAIFVSDMLKSRPPARYQVFLERLTALIWPAHPERAMQRVARTRHRTVSAAIDRQQQRRFQ
jgi:hypothetical protein